MIKSKSSKYPVITIQIQPIDKNALKDQAAKNGMQLATYCRMILLNSLKEAK